MSDFNRPAVLPAKARKNPIPERKRWETLQYMRYSLFLLTKNLPKPWPKPLRQKMIEMDQQIQSDKRSKTEDGPVISYGKDVIRNMYSQKQPDLSFYLYSFDANKITNLSLRENAVNAYRYTHERAVRAFSMIREFFNHEMQMAKEQQSLYQISKPIHTTVAYLPGFEQFYENNPPTPKPIVHSQKEIIFEEAGHMGRIRT